ncbi:MAG: hypothetical protein K9I85_06790 [Saprospiraceae bacterium]|nr:hypothetical protein [Saprospiraceae bacterium]
MRVVGEIPHPVYKITLFHYQDRWTLQVANGPYQFRTSMVQGPGLETVEDMQTFIDQTFLQEARDLFEKMHQATRARIARIVEENAAKD